MRLNRRGKIQLVILSLVITIASIVRVDACCKNVKIASVPDPDLDVNIPYCYKGKLYNYVEISEVHVIELVDNKLVDYSEYINENDVELLTNLLYGEARGIEDKAQRAAVVWCVLNRLDSGRWGNTLYEVVTAKNQFDGYVPNRTYSEEDSYAECKSLVKDILERYYHEKFSDEEVGRILPKDYYFFYGKNGINVFTKEWRDGTRWDWSLDNPYKEN